MKNVGIVDRIIRFVIAALIAILYFTGIIGGSLAIILGIVALAMLVTGLIGWCGLYSIFGIKTCPSKK